MATKKKTAVVKKIDPEKDKRLGSKNNPVTADQIAAATAPVEDDNEEIHTIIVKANLKDGKCPFTYEITNGKYKGYQHKVAGPGLYMDSLKTIFASFNVHLAVGDDMFKHAGIEIDKLSDMDLHELTLLFTCTGFKITGAEEDECVIIYGNKFLSILNGRGEIKTPKIPLDGSSSYPYRKELKALVAAARAEVERYRDGHFTLPNEPEKKTKFKQEKMDFDQNPNVDVPLPKKGRGGAGKKKDKVAATATDEQPVLPKEVAPEDQTTVDDFNSHEVKE